MAIQFGEHVPDEVAYQQARGALKHIDDLDTVVPLVQDSEIKQRALDDERAARAALNSENPS